jgi:hypothetical protein
MDGPGSASSPLPFPADGDLQSTPKTQQAFDFNFFSFLFTDLFFSSPFWVCFCLYRSAFLWLFCWLGEGTCQGAGWFVFLF